MDWAQKTIKDLEERNLVDDDATRFFAEAYREGDSVEAWEQYSSKAEAEEVFNPNCYILLIFPDGSCYASWREGVDCFYPDLSTLTDDDHDVLIRFFERDIEDRNYEIMHQEDCNCSFDWHIDGDTIDDGCDSNECLEANVLYVDGEQIAEYVRYNGLNMLNDRFDCDDIPDEIVDEMRMSDVVERGDTGNNSTHDERRKDALVEWLESLVDDGYRLMRDNQRGFANEYVVILVSPDAEPDDIDDDWDKLDAEEWADQYLYTGDAATEAYNGSVVI